MPINLHLFQPFICRAQKVSTYEVKTRVVTRRYFRLNHHMRQAESFEEYRLPFNVFGQSNYEGKQALLQKNGLIRACLNAVCQSFEEIQHLSKIGDVAYQVEFGIYAIEAAAQKKNP